MCAPSLLSGRPSASRPPFHVTFPHRAAEAVVQLQDVLARPRWRQVRGRGCRSSRDRARARRWLRCGQPAPARPASPVSCPRRPAQPRRARDGTGHGAPELEHVQRRHPGPALAISTVGKETCTRSSAAPTARRSCSFRALPDRAAPPARHGSIRASSRRSGSSRCFCGNIRSASAGTKTTAKLRPRSCAGVATKTRPYPSRRGLGFDARQTIGEHEIRFLEGDRTDGAHRTKGRPARAARGRRAGARAARAASKTRATLPGCLIRPGRELSNDRQGESAQLLGVVDFLGELVDARRPGSVRSSSRRCNGTRRSARSACESTDPHPRQARFREQPLPLPRRSSARIVGAGVHLIGGALFGTASG